jgi:tetratricopeptide (TPR) repeat protein
MNITKVLRLSGLLLLILALSFEAAAQEQKEEAISSAEYTRVLDNLLKQESAGIANADMYNQIGLSYYHQGYTGKAVVYFLRALRLNSNHGEAKNNLDFAISRSPDKDMYSQPSFLSSVFQKVFNFFTLNSLAFITLLLLLISVLCLHWLMHVSAGQDKAVPVMWLIIVGFILLLATVLLAFKYRDFRSDRTAVITDREAEGFSGPGEEFGKLFTIHEGLVIHISRVDKDWALITLPNGGAGWVLASSLERVKN